MALVGRSDVIVTEWLLNSDKYQTELKKLNRDLRAQEAAEKRISYIQKKLEQQSEKTADAVAGLGEETKKTGTAAEEAGDNITSMIKGMTAANVASQALEYSFNAIKDTISDSIESGRAWAGNLTGVEKETRAAAKAVDNLIPQVALAKLSEYKNELKWTEQEFQNVAKAAIYYSRVNKEDTTSSLNTVIDTVSTLSIEGFQKLGINLQNLSGPRAEQMKIALDALNLKFSDMTIKTSNADEKIAAITNRMEDFRGETMASLVQSKEYLNALEAWNSATMLFYQSVGFLIKSFGELIEYTKDFDRVTTNWLTKGATYRASAAEAEVAELKKINDEWAAALAVDPEDIDKRVKEQFEAEQRIKKATAEKTKTKKPTATEIIAPTFSVGAENLSDVLKKMWEPEMIEVAGQMLDEQTAKVSAITEKYDAERKAIQRLQEQQLAQIDANYAVAQSYEEMFSSVDRVSKDMIDMSMQGFSAMAQGLFNNIELAKKGEITYAQAAQNSAKETLMSLGAQSLGKGAFELAEGIAALALTWGIPNPASIGHFLASAKYLAFAAAFGGGGIAIPSAGGKSAGTSSGKSAASTGGSATQRTQSTAFAEKEKKMPDMKIIVLLQDGSPSGRILENKRIKAQLNQ